MREDKIINKPLDIPFKEFMPGQIIQSVQFNDDMKDIEDKVNEIVDKHNLGINKLHDHLEDLNNPHNVTPHQIGTYTNEEIDEFVDDIKNGNLFDKSISNRVLDDECVDTRVIQDGSVTASKVDPELGSQLNLENNISITSRYTKEETDAIIRERVGDGTYSREEIDSKFEEYQAGTIVDGTIGVDKLKYDVGTKLDISANPSITDRYTKTEVNNLIQKNGLPKDWGGLGEVEEVTPITDYGYLPIADVMTADEFIAPLTPVLDIDVKENVDARGEYSSVGDRLNKNDEKQEELSSQLEHIENNINITPENFEGTDIEKIQQALDYAIENNIKTIQLNRTYNLTGGVIYYNGGYSQPPTFKDGLLIKEDSGFMFSRVENNNNSNSPLFFNVTFRGKEGSICYIIDGDKMIRQNFVNCNFKYIALIKTDSYIQSLRLDNCEMFLSPDIFIKCAECYDVNITNNRFEESHKTLIKCYSDSSEIFANNSIRITNNLIEGYVYEVPIVLSSAYGLIIANNYFEYNNGDIEFVKSKGINNVNGSINNNSFYRSKTNWHIKANGNNVYNLHLNANSSNVPYGNGNSLTVGLGGATITNTYINSGGNVYPSGTVLKSSGVKYEVINDNGKSAIRITPRTNTKTDILDLIGNIYLIGFSGTFGSSIHYRANYLGVLGVGGNWDASNSQTCRELKLTKLHSSNTSGTGGNNEDWTSSHVSVRFESAGTNKISVTSDDNIIITFNNIPYNSAYSKAWVKNLEGLLTNGINIENTIQS